MLNRTKMIKGQIIMQQHCPGCRAQRQGRGDNVVRCAAGQEIHRATDHKETSQFWGTMPYLAEVSAENSEGLSD